MSIPDDLRFTESHEWVRVTGDTARVGITHHAQEQLGEVVFFEAPEMGAEYGKGDTVGVVESVKAVSDVYTPLSGEIAGINEALEDEPELVNSAPYGGGWMFEVKLSDPSEVDSLMDAAAYAEFAGS